MDKTPYYEAVICEIYDNDCANYANCEKAPRGACFAFRFIVAGLDIVACCANFRKEELERLKKHGLPLVLSRESVDALKNTDGCKNE